MNKRASFLQFARFLVVGILNTVVGFGVFWIAFSIFGVGPHTANAIGYVVAVSIAYFLNRHFVFRSRLKTSRILHFVGCFLVAFLANQLFIFAVNDFGPLDPYSVQIAAMIFYTAIFFALNKFFVFDDTILAEGNDERSSV